MEREALGTVKTRAAKVYSWMRLVEHNVSEKALEGDNYADLVVGADVGMADANEVLEVSAKLHHLLGDLTTGEAHAMLRRSSGLKCINSVHNPPRIAEVRQMSASSSGDPNWRSSISNMLKCYRRRCV